MDKEVLLSNIDKIQKETMKKYTDPNIDLYKYSTNPIEIRDSAMLHIFLNCGLRLSEIKNLNIEDINLNDDKFTIIGKGNKERTIYLNKACLKAISEYLEVRPKQRSST